MKKVFLTMILLITILLISCEKETCGTRGSKPNAPYGAADDVTNYNSGDENK